MAIRKPKLVQKALPPVVINDLEDYIRRVSEYASSTAQLKCYRGQQDAQWEPIPSLFRKDLTGLERCEKRAIRDLMSVHPAEFADDRSMFDRLVRMQHFGLPTRLMDVSLNPLIALYFASEEHSEHDDVDGMVVGFSIPAEREKYFDSDSVAAIANLANMTADEKNAIIALRAAGC